LQEEILANLEDLRIDAPVPKPRRSQRSSFPWVLLLAALAGLVWYKQAELAPLLGRLQPARPVNIFTVPSAESGPAGSITAGGYLEVIPPGPQIVSALIDGRVNSLEVAEGEVVQAGQIVARLDSTLIEQEARVAAADVELARAQLDLLKAGFRSEELDRARANLDSADAALVRAQADEGRMKQLYDQGIISRAEYDAAVSALGQAQAERAARQSDLNLLAHGQRKEDISIAQARLESAQASLGRANTRIAQSVIKTPVSGVVFESYVQPGGWVSPSESNAHPGAILSVIDPAMIQAWVDINQRDISRISLGQRCELVTDSQPQRRIAAVVERFLPKANLQKNTVQAKLRIEAPPVDLRPEMSVQVTFMPAEAADAAPVPAGVLVPKEAVLNDAQGSYVFVLSGSQASRRRVETLGEEAGQIRVSSGLGPGEQLITTPQGLSDGAKVSSAGQQGEESGTQ
jgi:RND family efflux transporter MFP subunit